MMWVWGGGECLNRAEDAYGRIEDVVVVLLSVAKSRQRWGIGSVRIVAAIFVNCGVGGRR